AAGRYGGLDKILAQPGRRRFHSHLPYALMPGAKSNIAKYVYVARNPKDNAISFYFHSRSKLGYDGTWDGFFERYLSGEVVVGPYLEHVVDWRQASHGLYASSRILLEDDLYARILQMQGHRGIQVGRPQAENLPLSQLCSQSL